MKYLLCLLFVAVPAFAEELKEPPKEPGQKPGEVYQVNKAGALERVDLTKLYVLDIQWRGSQPDGVEFGLRSDGVVVWRKR